MKEPIDAFRAYILDYDFQMMDYRTFLTQQEAIDWAKEAYPKNSHQITSMVITETNMRYLEILKQYKERFKSDVTEL